MVAGSPVVEQWLRLERLLVRHAPVLRDGGGNGYAVDAAPAPAGRVGQVINYGPDDDWRAVIASDLAGLLDGACRLLESGTVHREEVAGSPSLTVEIDGRRVDPLTGQP